MCENETYINVIFIFKNSLFTYVYVSIYEEKY